MCQLATRGPEGDSGNGNLTGVPELAVEEARRGSRIWLGLGGDLHRRSCVYVASGAGIDLVLHVEVQCVICEYL